MRGGAIITLVGWMLGAGLAVSKEDPGKTPVGRVTVSVYHATDGDPMAAGPRAVAISKPMAERFRKEARLRFKNYRVLGRDTQPLLRSYESWAKPLKPSEEVMVRFEAAGPPGRRSAVLDVELWLGRKKTVKTMARLEGDRPLLMLGPTWRGGRLIIGIALATRQKHSN